MPGLQVPHDNPSTPPPEAESGVRISGGDRAHRNLGNVDGDQMSDWILILAGVLSGAIFTWIYINDHESDETENETEEGEEG
jgi:hypothetical protein